MKARVFLALRVSEPLAADLVSDVRAALGGARAGRDYRLPRAEGMHLTLYFIGDTGRAELDRLGQLAREAFDALPAPRLTLTHAGAFPRRGRERVLWMGVGGVDPTAAAALSAVQAASLDVAERFGCDVRAEREGPFVPHVTVARPRARRPRVPAAFYALRGGAQWTPERVELLESVCNEGPARYETLEAFGLST